jgi:hypothetical protein
MSKRSWVQTPVRPLLFKVTRFSTVSALPGVSDEGATRKRKDYVRDGPTCPHCIMWESIRVVTLALR